uniref:Seed maturation protein PM41 n=1 Tax=Leersia perrieri TaxID=77586 RepID=A0A0D9X7G4_9ORYZ
MSGAQGAQPKGAFTATTYRSSPAAAARTELRSSEDERGLPVKRLEDTVEDAAGKGGPVFGAGKDDGKPDLGATGTG